MAVGRAFRCILSGKIARGNNISGYLSKFEMVCPKKRTAVSTRSAGTALGVHKSSGKSFRQVQLNLSNLSSEYLFTLSL